MTKQFRPQQRNANKHSLHGLRLLEKSVQQDGFIDAQTAAADGEIISGSARLELSAEKFADVEPIVVQSDGSRPVIVIRTDIPNLDDPRAKRLSVAANQIAKTDYDPDGELLAEWGKEDDDIRKMFSDAEWREIETAEMSEDEAFAKLPAADRAPFQQMTFTLHDSQAEQVKEAVRIAKAAGAFVDSENENSNGNALSRICETYITEHGNG
jgi:hypothetical protein